MVITSALRGGLRQGAAVATAPLVSDVVVVGVVLLALGRIPTGWLAVLGVVGGVAVAVVGLRTVGEGRYATLSTPTGESGGTVTALGRGSLVNLLSPHPWISWLTALGPLTVATWRDSPPAGIFLVVGFYATLVGSKVAVAALVAGGRRRLTDAGYRRAVVGAGLLLVVLGALMVLDFAL
jgi:threonine/homoserine/homoserine lactone efflux protein